MPLAQRRFTERHIKRTISSKNLPFEFGQTEATSAVKLRALKSTAYLFPAYQFDRGSLIELLAAKYVAKIEPFSLAAMTIVSLKHFLTLFWRRI